MSKNGTARLSHIPYLCAATPPFSAPHIKLEFAMFKGWVNVIRATADWFVQECVGRWFLEKVPPTSTTVDVGTKQPAAPFKYRHVTVCENFGGEAGGGSTWWAGQRNKVYPNKHNVKMISTRADHFDMCMLG